MSFAISFADVWSAAERLKGAATVTPVHTSRTLNAMTEREVFIKCENFQRTGSFKFRGAYNAINRLSDEQLEKGIVAFSSGNHGQAVALVAKLHHAPAIIVTPSDVAPSKLTAMRGYGAEIVTYDRLKEDRVAIGKQLAAERGMTVVPPYDHPHVMAGQGTLALEWLQAVPKLDALVIPVGGGGLIAGCAIAAKGINPNIRIFGVETEGADDTKLSLRKGERVAVPPPSTIADGIRTPMPGELTFPIVQALVEDIAVVSDAATLEAMRFLIWRMKLVTEPTGAITLAALLNGLIPVECRRVGLLLCGGNIASFDGV
ncbi:MAG: pyridoxal-phosphate dependent enzyme [Anaerolineae bacterium]|nr:pyridoxal-phosphate dependent enzyme [Anaerolineae bacterium]